METINGHALYIDILGMSNLTKGQILLSDLDYDTLNIPKSIPQEAKHHHVVFKLLAKFRVVLQDIQHCFSNVTVAQFSDCAFVWSKDIRLLLDAASRLMFSTLKSGLLCRAGISSGEILLPDKENRKIGKFIAGSAIANAVINEKLGKGCRLFTDSSFATNAGSEMPHSLLFYSVFCATPLPTDFTIVDEVRWFFIKNSVHLNKTGFVDADDIKLILINCADLIARLMHSPEFNWNAQNKEGCVHLAATIEALSTGMAELSKNQDLKMHAYTVIDHLKNRNMDALIGRRKAIEKTIHNTHIEPLAHEENH